MPRTKKQQTEEKPVITNYYAYKDELIKVISKGALCFSCLAREYCNSNGEDKDKDYCLEAWKKWADLSYKETQSDLDMN